MYIISFTEPLRNGLEWVSLFFTVFHVSNNSLDYKQEKKFRIIRTPPLVRRTKTITKSKIPSITHVHFQRWSQHGKQNTRILRDGKCPPNYIKITEMQLQVIICISFYMDIYEPIIRSVAPYFLSLPSFSYSLHLSSYHLPFISPSTIIQSKSISGPSSSRPCTVLQFEQPPKRH